MMNVYLCGLVFIFGLIIGSFLNVCIFRIPREESIVFPPSHCTSCGKGLGFFDLIPVLSYFFIKGKCRNCGEKISLRYPVIELVTGVVFASLFLKYQLSVEFIAAAYLMAVLIIVFFIDLDHRIIPHGLTISGLVGGLVLLIYSFIHQGGLFQNSRWLDHLLGLLPGSGILFLVAILGLVIYKSDEAMGMGDVYIFAPIGLFLGWRLCVLNLLLSVFLAGFISTILIVLKIKKRKDTIPFGPFIVIGTYIALMWGNGLLEWYFKSFI